MEKAIKLAIESGWKDDDIAYGMKEGERPSNGDPKVNGWYYSKETFLDPLFWQALGKSLGWANGGLERKWFHQSGEVLSYQDKLPKWRWIWSRFIDHLAEGKDADDYFKELLK